MCMHGTHASTLPVAKAGKVHRCVQGCARAHYLAAVVGSVVHTLPFPLLPPLLLACAAAEAVLSHWRSAVCIQACLHRAMASGTTHCM